MPNRRYLTGRAISNDRNSNDPNNHPSIFGVTHDGFVLVIEAFGIGICFGFRYSDFEFKKAPYGKSCPMGLAQGPILWARILYNRIRMYEGAEEGAPGWQLG